MMRVRQRSGSYTHLDVYKRQRHGHPGALPGSHQSGTAALPHCRSIRPVGQRPVSYTHLDVYKRQVQRVVDLVNNEQVLRSQAVDNLGNLELGVAFDRQA